LPNDLQSFASSNDFFLDTIEDIIDSFSEDDDMLVSSEASSEPVVPPSSSSSVAAAAKKKPTKKKKPNLQGKAGRKGYDASINRGVACRWLGCGKVHATSELARVCERSHVTYEETAVHDFSSSSSSFSSSSNSAGSVLFRCKITKCFSAKRGHAFKSLSMLLRHIREVHRDRSNGFRCGACNAWFKDGFSLRRHQSSNGDYSHPENWRCARQPPGTPLPENDYRALRKYAIRKGHLLPEDGEELSSDEDDEQ